MLTPEESYRISAAVYRSSFAATAPSFDEDLIQEGVIGIWRGFRAYRPGLASEATFASRLARNAMIDALRRLCRPASHKTFDFAEVVEPAFEEDLSAPEASDVLSRVEIGVRGDPHARHWREIIAGRIAGLADSEIARALGISKATFSREASRLAALAALALGVGTSPLGDRPQMA